MQVPDNFTGAPLALYINGVLGSIEGEGPYYYTWSFEQKVETGYEVVSIEVHPKYYKDESKYYAGCINAPSYSWEAELEDIDILLFWIRDRLKEM